MKATCILLVSLVLSTSALASSGKGGGGSDLAGIFRSLAEDLFDRLDDMGQSEVDTSKLEASLDSTRIEPVSILKDPNSGDPIPNQRFMLAWGTPGLIQLKVKVFEKVMKESESIDHHILHEICRASNGYCDDEGYRISVGKLHLDKTGNRFKLLDGKTFSAPRHCAFDVTYDGTNKTLFLELNDKHPTMGCIWDVGRQYTFENCDGTSCKAFTSIYSDWAHSRQFNVELTVEALENGSVVLSGKTVPGHDHYYEWSGKQLYKELEL